MERISAPDGKAESPHLYAARESVFPKAVDDLFSRLTWRIMGVTLTIYDVTSDRAGPPHVMPGSRIASGVGSDRGSGKPSLPAGPGLPTKFCAP